MLSRASLGVDAGKWSLCAVMEVETTLHVGEQMHGGYKCAKVNQKILTTPQHCAPSP